MLISVCKFECVSEFFRNVSSKICKKLTNTFKDFTQKLAKYKQNFIFRCGVSYLFLGGGGKFGPPIQFTKKSSTFAFVY
jgi:hypothetical protein